MSLFSLNHAFWFFVVYLIFSRGLFLLFPTYVNTRFAPVPKVKRINLIDSFVFYSAILYTIFIPLSLNKYLLYSGLIIYIVGINTLIISIYQFAISAPNKIVNTGLYALSRHPVYLSFYLLFLGICISTSSFVLLILWIIHILLQHQIIKKEEADLHRFYGKSYENYCRQTKRYI